MSTKLYDKCPYCNGTGKEHGYLDVPCSVCGGDGFIEDQENDGD